MSDQPGQFRRLVARARTVRRRYTDVPFGSLVAVLGVNNLVTLLGHPGAQAASLLASPLDYLWAGMYAAGGLLILVGLGTVRTNVEAAGCITFAAGALISALATVVVSGWDAWNTVGVLALFVGAAVTRASHLARGRVLVLLDVATGTFRDGRQ